MYVFYVCVFLWDIGLNVQNVLCDLSPLLLSHLIKSLSLSLPTSFSDPSLSAADTLYRNREGKSPYPPSLHANPLALFPNNVIALDICLKRSLVFLQTDTTPLKSPIRHPSEGMYTERGLTLRFGTITLNNSYDRAGSENMIYLHPKRWDKSLKLGHKRLVLSCGPLELWPRRLVHHHLTTSTRGHLGQTSDPACHFPVQDPAKRARDRGGRARAYSGPKTESHAQPLRSGRKRSLSSFSSTSSSVAALSQTHRRRKSSMTTRRNSLHKKRDRKMKLLGLWKGAAYHPQAGDSHSDSDLPDQFVLDPLLTDFHFSLSVTRGIAAGSENQEEQILLDVDTPGLHCQMYKRHMVLLLDTVKYFTNTFPPKPAAVAAKPRRAEHKAKVEHWVGRVGVGALSLTVLHDGMDRKLFRLGTVYVYIHVSYIRQIYVYLSIFSLSLLLFISLSL